MLVAEAGLGERPGQLADGRARHLRQVGHHLQQRVAQPPTARPPPGRLRAGEQFEWKVFGQELRPEV